MGEMNSQPMAVAQAVEAAPPAHEDLLMKIIEKNQQAFERAQRAAIRSQAEIDLDVDQRTAKLFAMSGNFADLSGNNEVQGLAKAFTKIRIGRSLGMTEGESLINLDFIKGTPSIRAHYRAAKMKALGYTWKFKQFDRKGCILEIYNPSGEYEGESSYVEEDARANSLLTKDNWVKNPKNMYFCRAVSNGQRWYAPEAFNANVPSIEEMDEDTPERYDKEKYQSVRAKKQKMAEEFLAGIEKEEAQSAEPAMEEVA